MFKNIDLCSFNLQISSISFDFCYFIFFFKLIIVTVFSVLPDGRRAHVLHAGSHALRGRCNEEETLQY